MNKRMKKSLWALVGTMLCGCLLLAPGARAAETTALEDTLEQTARLQQLAEEYAAGRGIRRRAADGDGAADAHH